MGCLYSKDCCIWHVPTSSRSTKLKESENARPVAGAAVSPISSDGLGEDGQDQLHQLSLNRDSNAGINRLSRVSSQFLPPDGSRTVRVPLGNYDLRYSYLSQRGYYPDALDKANQDSFCIHTPCGTSPDDHFFGVFDGHGECGAQCSQFVKRKLCENLLRNGRFYTDPVEACHAAFLATNSQLHSDSLDDTMSGTTGITVLVRGRTIYVANCGDSRAVIAERRGKDIVAVDLSIDQTPFRTDELERVKLSGARVLTLDQIEGLKNPDVQCWDTEEGDDGDPPRVWVQNGMYPGTAFTRSIGDSIAESIGVVATPEIVVLELTENHPFFVLASDGVFEFLSSQTVVDMVAKFKDPRDACAAIVAESYRLWLQYETRTDDITIIVVHINGLSDTGSVQGASNFNSRSLPQVVEVTGSESPSTFSWNSRNQRVRHDLSRARLKAIECSLDNGHAWMPPSPSHRKTWEEEAHIERVLHDHFLFRRVTDSQCRVLLDCMQRVEVKSGDIVVQQGGEGDCFYVVGSGEFEVFANQEEENGGEAVKVLHKYTAEKLSSFGELALMYNKPLQASVRAVTSGTLWALKREDFREILMSEFSNLSSLKLLRSVDLFSRLTILQLNNISSALEEISFSDGQTVINKNECISALHIILKGQVKVTYDDEILRSPNIRCLPSVIREQEQHLENNSENEVLFSEGSHFGEWALFGEKISSLSAVAVGEVVCAVITKDKFDSAVGPLPKLTLDDRKLKHSLNSLKEYVANDATTLSKVQLSDLEWRMCISATDCSELGLVLLKGSGDYINYFLVDSYALVNQLFVCCNLPSKYVYMDSLSTCEYVEASSYTGMLDFFLNKMICAFIFSWLPDNILSLKRFSKKRIKQLGKETQVLKERDLMKSLSQSTHVPHVLCTCADQLYLGILLNACLSCSLSSIMYKPLDEASARFCAASVVVALEELHNNAILYRGVSPEILMFDQHGHLQLVDFRFGKKLDGERTFTICGIADSLSPEILQGKGHGLAADWWALGVLIYFMLEAEMPFGSWRESELETFAKIAKGHLTLPETFSVEVIDLITKLLEIDETARLGSQGADSIKKHPWFHGLDWKAFADCTASVPQEITNRIDYYLENHAQSSTAPISSVSEDIVELNCPEWFEDW